MDARAVAVKWHAEVNAGNSASFEVPAYMSCNCSKEATVRAGVWREAAACEASASESELSITLSKLIESSAWLFVFAPSHPVQALQFPHSESTSDARVCET